MEICKLAIETCMWPLYEVIEGKWILSYTPKTKRPVIDYLKPQGRFSHILTPGNEHLVEELQKTVDKKWESLLNKCESA